MTESNEPQTPVRRAQRVLAIVPARLGSTRLPRKMLLCDTGRFLFEHTVRNTMECPSIDRVVLATDSAEILAAAEEVGLEAVPTSDRHRSGTDRVHEAWCILAGRGEGPWDVVINVQGDEPELPPEDLATLIEAFADPEIEIATLSAQLRRREEAEDPSVVKVVVDCRGDALYFSRSAIPSLRHPSRPMSPDSPGWRGLRRHIGGYAFRPEALTRFCALPHGVLELTESLEQLRWLENGGKMRVLEASQLTTGIDTREQYEAFCARLSPADPIERSHTP